MAFPSNPVDGQMWGDYVYDASLNIWSPNRWRPLLNFGNNTRFTGVTGINSSAGCTAAGISVYADQFNHANYTPSSNYLTWFYNSTPNGTLTFALPEWSTKYYIRYGCTSGASKLQHYDSSIWVDINTISQTTGESRPEIHQDYYGVVPDSKQIRLWEQGVSSIWWIFIQ